MCFLDKLIDSSSKVYFEFDGVDEPRREIDYFRSPVAGLLVKLVQKDMMSYLDEACRDPKGMMWIEFFVVKVNALKWFLRMFLGHDGVVLMLRDPGEEEREKENFSGIEHDPDYRQAVEVLMEMIACGLNALSNCKSREECFEVVAAVDALSCMLKAFRSLPSVYSRVPRSGR